MIAPRSTLALAIAFSLVLFACQGDSGASAAPNRASGGEAVVQEESSGPVVISAPTSRYSVKPSATPATILGTVSLEGTLDVAPTPSGRDSGVCGPAIPDSSVQRRGSGLGNVVVWLEGLRSGKPLPLEKRLELESDHCILTPRIQAAVIGSAVNVIGHYDFRQHLRFVAGGDKAARAAVLLGKDEQVIPTNLPATAPGLVVIRDVDHAWVRAYIAVFDHPYFAVTKPDGSFTIDGVPPGKYTLVAWHERTGKTEQPVEVSGGGTVKVAVKLKGK